MTNQSPPQSAAEILNGFHYEMCPVDRVWPKSGRPKCDCGLDDASHALYHAIASRMPEKMEPLVPGQHTVSDAYNAALNDMHTALASFFGIEEGKL